MTSKAYAVSNTLAAAAAGLLVQAYKVAQEELRLGSIADAVACRIASRDCNS